MLILTQTDILVNVDAIKSIYADFDGTVDLIYAEMIDGEDLLLGMYNSKPGYEIIEKIGQSYGAVNLFVMEKELKDDCEET